MIAAASVQLGELGPVVSVIYKDGSWYKHSHYELSSDADALAKFESLGVGAGMPVEDGYLHISGMPDEIKARPDGLACLGYGEQMLCVTGGKKHIVAIMRRVADLIEGDDIADIFEGGA